MAKNTARGRETFASVYRMHHFFYRSRKDKLNTTKHYRKEGLLTSPMNPNRYGKEYGKRSGDLYQGLLHASLFYRSRKDKLSTTKHYRKEGLLTSPMNPNRYGQNTARGRETFASVYRMHHFYYRSRKDKLNTTKHYRKEGLLTSPMNPNRYGQEYGNRSGDLYRGLLHASLLLSLSKR